MGWSESPLFFCAASETARDLADQYYPCDINFPAHKNKDIVLDINWSKIPKQEQSQDLAFLHLIECYIGTYNQLTIYSKLSLQVPDTCQCNPFWSHTMLTYDFIGLIQLTDPEEIKRFT